MKTWARQNKQKGIVIEIAVGERLRYTTQYEINHAVTTWPIVKRALYRDTFAGGKCRLFTSCHEYKHHEECLIVVTQSEQSNSKHILVPNQLYAHDFHLHILNSKKWKLIEKGEND